MQTREAVFYQDVITGLNADKKSIPCKYFYDETGSKLFDKICELDEYYLTRTETSIIEENAVEIAEQLGEGVMLVEMGSGSSIKTRLLLDELIEPACYVPVDISEEHLQKAAETLRSLYPDLEVIPVTADFTKGFELPESKINPSHSAIFFPGSTIGNFSQDQAKDLLDRFGQIVGQQGGMVIGLDLIKDQSIIESAYNDEEGITAAFNLNILSHINRELDGNFDIDKFEHNAVYNSEKSRVEIGLISQEQQTVSIGGQSFNFEPGEYIHTENSHKYSVDSFAELAEESGFELHKVWKDSREYFAVLHLVVA